MATGGCSCPPRNRKNLAPTLRNVYAPTLDPHPPADPFSSRPTTHDGAGKEMQAAPPIPCPMPRTHTQLQLQTIIVVVVLLATHKSRREAAGGQLKGSCLLHVLGLHEQLLPRLLLAAPPPSGLRCPCKIPSPGQVNKLQAAGRGAGAGAGANF